MCLFQVENTALHNSQLNIQVITLMFYPKCMIIVTISKWHQFSSYQAALENPALAVLGWTEFGEKKKNYFWLSCYIVFFHWGWKYKKDKWQIEDVSLAIINTSSVEQALRQKAVPHHHRLLVPFISLCWAEHRGGDRTLLGTQPHQPCYITITTTSSEKTPMALHLCT